MSRQNFRVPAFLAAALLVFACMPTFGATPAPTFDPNAITTLIVQTANAAGTQTALVVSPTFTPSPTSLPSATPSITPTPTITFVFLLRTATVTTPTSQPGASGLKYDCQVLSKIPPDDSHIPPKADFLMDWQVYNTGTMPWDAKNADYRYRSGDQLSANNVYDLPNSVPSGGKTDIKVAMKAPQQSGTFSTIWYLRVGQFEFCRMSLTIHVP